MSYLILLAVHRLELIYFVLFLPFLWAVLMLQCMMKFLHVLNQARHPKCTNLYIFHY